MAGLPKNFDAISPVLASYDFVDIVAGTGYINFYPGTTVDLRVMSNFPFYSDTLLDEHTTGYADYTLMLDHDYDATLNRPLDIKGLGIVNIPVYASIDKYIYAVVTLRKYSGSTETDIVANTSRIVQDAAAGVYSMLAVDLNIPLTHFKIGDKLRLTIQIYGKGTGGSPVFQYGHDPKGRASDGILDWDSTGAVTSILVFQCPVRLNI